jgi:predicted metal-binding membrane protein
VLEPGAAAIVSGRDRLLVWTCLALISALAWSYLLYLGRQMSESMAYGQMMADMGMVMNEPWGAADLFFTFVMWAVMMVGMMAPSAAPTMLLFSATARRRQAGHWSAPVLAFGIGYLLIWTGFSAAAALAQWGLHEATLLSPEMAASSAMLSGLILIAAGVYQLTPFKGACLTQCRSPLGFLVGHWRDGVSGALRMGVRHGALCLGCCWALMCVLFVVGVMNLLWVAALAALVLLEKVGPRGQLVARVAGLAMTAAGLVVIVRQ